MAAEALRSSGFTASAALRSSSGFHNARGRSTAPRRRGSAFPRLLRLPPPRTAARRLLDEASGAGSKGRLRAPPRASPSSSLPSSPSLLPSLVAANLGGKSPWAARYREADAEVLYRAALGFPGRWMDGGQTLASAPKGTRRPSGWEGGGVGHGRCGALPHGARHAGHGMEDREERRDGERADPWTPHVSGCGVLGRWELGCGLRWAERPNGLAV
jgi:hypothetical protein